MGENEFKYVSEAFDLNWIAPVGPHLNDFETKLSEISDKKYIAALSSGTSAIHLALILFAVLEEETTLYFAKFSSKPKAENPLFIISNQRAIS